MRRRAFAKRRAWQRGTMNKGEQAYADHLEILKQRGVIADYYFEGSTWLVGPNCRFTPDFTVFCDDGEMQLHEVKGNRKGRWHAEDDAKVKMKAFVDKWKMPLYIVYPKDGRRYDYWNVEVIG